MNGGAVRDERSPENDAILRCAQKICRKRMGEAAVSGTGYDEKQMITHCLMKLAQLLFWDAGTPYITLATTPIVTMKATRRPYSTVWSSQCYRRGGIQYPHWVMDDDDGRDRQHPRAWADEAVYALTSPISFAVSDMADARLR